MSITERRQQLSKPIPAKITKPKASTKPRKTMAIPAIEEVRNYCIERGNNVDPERWWDFYQAKGWMVGKNRMKDWRAAVRTWEHNGKGRADGKTLYEIFEREQQILDSRNKNS